MLEPVPVVATTVLFAEAARRLADACRARGLIVPGFRSPPAHPTAPRTLRRRPDGGAIVAVRVRGRSLSAVVNDLVDGVVAANGVTGPARERLRAELVTELGGDSPARRLMVVIRPVAPEEYVAVAQLTVDVYAVALGATLSDAYRVELTDVARRAEHALVLVAIDATGGDVVGSITYVPGPDGPYSEFPAADEAGLRMLVVAPEAQRRGIGSQLVQACIDQARRDGKARLSLHTTPALTGAQRLYEGLGFRRAPDRDWGPEPGVHLLGYVLEL